MKRQHILEAWNEFQRIVLPPNISEIQRTETRRAFFAGCCSMFHFMTTNPLVIEASEESSLSVFSEINSEISDYADRLRKGSA